MEIRRRPGVPCSRMTFGSRVAKGMIRMMDGFRDLGFRD